MSPAYALQTGFTRTEVFYLAFGNQILYGSGNLFNRHIRIYTVLVKQIDVVRF